jgi:hypothetical protein
MGEPRGSGGSRTLIRSGPCLLIASKRTWSEYVDTSEFDIWQGEAKSAQSFEPQIIFSSSSVRSLRHTDCYNAGEQSGSD